MVNWRTWCLEKPLDSDGSKTLGSNLFSLPLRKEEFIQLVHPRNRGGFLAFFGVIYIYTYIHRSTYS